MADDLPLAAFRAALLGDAALQARLAPLRDSAAFVSAAVEEAAERRIDLDPAHLAALLTPDPLGLHRFRPRPITQLTDPGVEWLPVATVATPEGPVVDWMHFAGAALTDPFFEGSLRSARALPINRVAQCRTPLAALEGAAASESAVKPSGFVFHLSRCGSTLVAQMLEALEGTTVVSEAAPLDEMLQALWIDPALPAASRVAMLRAIVRVLGRDRMGDARHAIFKLDSWHALALPLFRQAFPDTPWVFLYRDPVEILVSQAAMRGVQTDPQVLRHIHGITDSEAMSGEAFVARLLGRICAAVLDGYALGGGLLVDYAELPAAVETKILPHFQIAPDCASHSAMAAAVRRDAKDPTVAFADDTQRKHAAATPEIRAAAEAFVADAIRRLDLLRHAELDRV